MAVRSDRWELDPELAAMQVMMPSIDLANLPAARATELMLTREMHASPATQLDTTVTIEEVSCPRADGSQLVLRRYAPVARGQVRLAMPGLVFLHGGSFVTGGLHTEDARCRLFAGQAQLVVVSVDYRLAPEHPYPAGLDDAWLALCWTAEHADRLGIDPTRLAIGGLSAGGALAASLAARAVDQSDLGLRLQMLLYPALDARAHQVADVRYADAPGLDARTVQLMWAFYLASATADHGSGQYASPADRPGLAGLPAAYIAVAEIDPLRDEAIRYATRLLADGVSVDLRLWARTFHGFDAFSATRLAKAALADQVAALRAALR